MSKATKATEGHVYFLYAPSVERVKIGFSVDLDKRMNELRLGSPTELLLLRRIRGTLQLEIALLALWDRYRLHGEWFTASPDLLRYIKHLQNDKNYFPDELIKNIAS